MVLFGKRADIAAEYLHKGAQVYIEGELRYDKYTGQDGVEKYTTDIIANELQMLDGREQQTQTHARISTQPHYNSRLSQSRDPAPSCDIDDDDIAFSSLCNF